MTPRLTNFGRHIAAIAGTPVGAVVRLSRPSPAERLRQRRKARAAVMRSMDRRDEVDLHLAYLIGKHA